MTRPEKGQRLNNLSQIYNARGDYATALEYLEQSLAIRQKIGDKAGEGTALNSIGQIYAAQSDYVTALKYLEQSLKIVQVFGDKAEEAAISWNIGQIYLRQDDLVKAEMYISRTVQIEKEIDHPDFEQDRNILEQIRTKLQQQNDVHE